MVPDEQLVVHQLQLPQAWSALGAGRHSPQNCCAASKKGSLACKRPLLIHKEAGNPKQIFLTTCTLFWGIMLDLWRTATLHVLCAKIAKSPDAFAGGLDLHNLTKLGAGVSGSIPHQPPEWWSPQCPPLQHSAPSCLTGQEMRAGSPSWPGSGPCTNMTSPSHMCPLPPIQE
jgi:hypothetical protein